MRVLLACLSLLTLTAGCRTPGVVCVDRGIVAVGGDGGRDMPGTVPLCPCWNAYGDTYIDVSGAPDGGLRVMRSPAFLDSAN